MRGLCRERKRAQNCRKTSVPDLPFAAANRQTGDEDTSKTKNQTNNNYMRPNAEKRFGRYVRSGAISFGVTAAINLFKEFVWKK